MSDLATWLGSIHHTCADLVAPLDANYGVETVDDLLLLEPSDVTAIIETLKRVHAKKFCGALEALRKNTLAAETAPWGDAKDAQASLGVAPPAEPSAGVSAEAKASARRTALLKAYANGCTTGGYTAFAHHTGAGHKGVKLEDLAPPARYIFDRRFDGVLQEEVDALRKGNANDELTTGGLRKSVFNKDTLPKSRQARQAAGTSLYSSSVRAAQVGCFTQPYSQTPLDLANRPAWHADIGISTKGPVELGTGPGGTNRWLEDPRALKQEVSALRQQVDDTKSANAAKIEELTRQLDATRLELTTQEQAKRSRISSVGVDVTASSKKQKTNIKRPVVSGSFKHFIEASNPQQQCSRSCR